MRVKIISFVLIKVYNKTILACQLDRRATLSESRNKEHANALSLSAKKLIELERAITAHKFTAKDIAKCLGDCLHSGVVCKGDASLFFHRFVFSLSCLCCVIIHLFNHSSINC